MKTKFKRNLTVFLLTLGTLSASSIANAQSNTNTAHPLNCSEEMQRLDEEWGIALRQQCTVLNNRPLGELVNQVNGYYTEIRNIIQNTPRLRHLFSEHRVIREINSCPEVINPEYRDITTYNYDRRCYDKITANIKDALLRNPQVQSLIRHSNGLFSPTISLTVGSASNAPVAGIRHLRVTNLQLILFNEADTRTIVGGCNQSIRFRNAEFNTTAAMPFLRGVRVSSGAQETTFYAKAGYMTHDEQSRFAAGTSVYDFINSLLPQQCRQLADGGDEGGNGGFHNPAHPRSVDGGGDGGNGGDGGVHNRDMFVDRSNGASAGEEHIPGEEQI